MEFEDEGGLVIDISFVPRIASTIFVVKVGAFLI